MKRLILLTALLVTALTLAGCSSMRQENKPNPRPADTHRIFGENGQVYDVPNS